MACIATSHALDQILKGFFKENRGHLYYSKIFIAFLACATFEKICGDKLSHALFCVQASEAFATYLSVFMKICV